MCRIYANIDQLNHKGLHEDALEPRASRRQPSTVRFARAIVVLILNGVRLSNCSATARRLLIDCSATACPLPNSSTNLKFGTKLMLNITLFTFPNYCLATAFHARPTRRMPTSFEHAATQLSSPCVAIVCPLRGRQGSTKIKQWVNKPKCNVLQHVVHHVTWSTRIVKPTNNMRQHIARFVAFCVCLLPAFGSNVCDL